MEVFCTKIVCLDFVMCLLVCVWRIQGLFFWRVVRGAGGGDVSGIGEEVSIEFYSLCCILRPGRYGEAIF